MHFNTSGDSSLGERGMDNDNVWVNLLDRSLADDVLNYNFDDGVADYASQRQFRLGALSCVCRF